MNRRGFIGRIAAVLGAAAAPAVGAEEVRDAALSLDAKLQAEKELAAARDKYWDAQRHINELEDEL